MSKPLSDPSGPASVREIVARTTAAQGVPHRLSDPGALSTIAYLLASGQSTASPSVQENEAARHVAQIGGRDVRRSRTTAA